MDRLPHERLGSTPPLTDFSPLENQAKQTHDFPYVSAILPLDGFLPLVGFYPRGVEAINKAPLFVPTAQERDSLEKRRSWKRPDVSRLNLAVTPPLPVPAGVPTWNDLKAMQEELKRVPALPLAADSNPENPLVVALPDDWTTQGTWLGRYGPALLPPPSIREMGSDFSAPEDSYAPRS